MGAEYYDKMTKRLEGEVEVIKHTYGAFTNTELENYLKAKGIKTIINIGCLTNVCVEYTAAQGWFAGYYSIMPSDAVGSTLPSLHEAILLNHKIFFGFTPKSDEIISIWKEVDR
jgi:ureidoacrylate peracid hydrolase